MIALLVIASLVVWYLPLYHSTSPHPEWNTLCGANLLLPYIRLSSVLPFLQSLPCARVSTFLYIPFLPDSFIAKVRDVKIKPKVDDADIEKLTDDRKKLIGDEFKLLEDHRKANKEILTHHFYDMSNMMSRNEGVWLSNGWVKTLLWIFLPCFLYTVISIVYFVASCIDK